MSTETSTRRLVSQAELARLRGVSRQAAAKACATKLASARYEDRWDLDHPAVVAWLSDGPPAAAKGSRKRPPVPTGASPKRGKRPAKTAPAPTTEPPPEPAVPAPQGTRELEELSALLRPLLDRYGTSRGFRDWLQAAAQLEAVRERKLRNDEREGRLIDRTLVSTHLMGALQRLHRRLLGDSAVTTVRRVYAAAKAGLPVEEVEVEYRAAIGALLKPVAETQAALLRERGGSGESDDS